MNWDLVITISLKIVVVVVLVLLNGFFVAAEFALVKVRSTQLDPLIAKGHRRARVARHLMNNIDAFLSAAQLGITLTSLGALGGIVSTPVINHPEVAIVGVNRIVARPVIRDGAVVARQMMNLSSSFDHRVVDGMHAARFMQALRAALECPALLFIE